MYRTEAWSHEKDGQLIQYQVHPVANNSTRCFKHRLTHSKNVSLWTCTSSVLTYTGWSGEMLVHLSDFLKLVKRCIFTHIPAQLASIALSCGGTLFETSFSQKYQWCQWFFSKNLFAFHPKILYCVRNAWSGIISVPGGQWSLHYFQTHIIYWFYSLMLFCFDQFNITSSVIFSILST